MSFVQTESVGVDVDVPSGALSSLESQIEAKNHHILSLINRLSGFCDDKQSQRELIEMTQRQIEEFETLVESYELLVTDIVAVDSVARQRRVFVVLDRYKENCKLIKLRFRKAQVASIQQIKQRWEKERRQLFGVDPVTDENSESPSSNSKKKSNSNSSSKALATSDDIIMTKSDDISNTLRQLHQIAQAEVAKSELNIEELEHSTKSLTELGEKYGSYDILLHGSRLLVQHLEEADKWDRIYMLLSLGFLCLVLCWIVWRRILKGPVMLLLWSMTKTLGLFGGAVNFVVSNGDGEGDGEVEYVFDLSGSLSGSLSESLSETILETAVQTAEAIVTSLSSFASLSVNATSNVSDSVSTAISSVTSVDTILHNEL